MTQEIGDKMEELGEFQSKVWKYVIFAAFCGVVVGSALGTLTWFHAPVVGGEFWPYIRFLASTVVFVISAYLTFYLLGAIFVSRVQREFLFGKGDEDDPWSMGSVSEQLNNEK